jgi:E3 ubiquitin-protein ligase ZSWIM2
MKIEYLTTIVRLGFENACSCSVFMSEHELCVHILWILLKKLRVPSQNPLVYQLSLGILVCSYFLTKVERETDEILRGNASRHVEAPAAASAPAEGHAQRPIAPEDVCPICQEPLLR